MGTCQNALVQISRCEVPSTSSRLRAEVTEASEHLDTLFARDGWSIRRRHIFSGIQNSK